MRHTRANSLAGARGLASLLATAALAFAWVGCGAAGAQDENDSEATQQESGFFERLLEPDPEPVVVPADTVLVVRLQDTLSSHETAVGTAFSARVTQEVSVDGRAAIPVDSIVRGQVTAARPAKKIGGRATLSVTFDGLETPDGQSVAIAAHLAESGRSELGKDIAIIGGGTIGGAILGEAIHEGEGGTVGAIVGGIAGTVGALKTKGKPVVLPAGTSLHIALESPVELEVK